MDLASAPPADATTPSEQPPQEAAHHATEPEDAPPAAAALHFPRSFKSIAFALDQLESEAYDDEEDFASDATPPGLPSTSEGPSGGEDGGDDDDDALLRRAAAAQALDSHPLDFCAQFPRVAVVTTAALPWLTGTAVNPALRAAYLWRRGHAVTLVVPWVPPADQPRLFPDGAVFATPAEQAVAVADAIQRRVPFPLPPGACLPTSARHDFRLVFYKGRYDPGLGSIMPEEDIQAVIPQPVDLIVLEEPEHLTWYHTGRRWTRAFPRNVPVIGVMHTNYVDYARREAGEAAAAAIRRLNRFLCRQHTHKAVKLSDAVQELPRQETCFVHGVARSFLEVGEERAPSTKGIYFLGKALWAKGFAELLERFGEHKAAVEDASGGSAVPPPPLPMVDVYGKGEQLGAIKAEAAAQGLPLRFLGAKDHLSPDMAAYRAFVNPSTSDVVATTTAEAMAMGKWVIVPEHPCNEFFRGFSNALIYKNAQEFSAAVARALREDPSPLSSEEARRLTWEAATDRFLHIAAATEVARGAPLARVAAKTGWLGYNVGYQVYAVASGVLDLVRKAVPASAAAEDDGGGAGVGETAAEPGAAHEGVASHALTPAV